MALTLLVRILTLGLVLVVVAILKFLIAVSTLMVLILTSVVAQDNCSFSNVWRHNVSACRTIRMVDTINEQVRTIVTIQYALDNHT